jgi:hypothetical protein
MKRNPRESGFILLAALGVFAVVGVALLTLAAASVYEGNRTIERSTRAQLDQLLLAGATDAAEHIKSVAPKAADTWTVELPQKLAEQNASLKAAVASADNNAVALTLHAQIDNRSAEQSLRFAREGTSWKLESASLDSASPQ